jgi:hypothetical protein
MRKDPKHIEKEPPITVKVSRDTWKRLNQRKRESPVTDALPSHDHVITELLDSADSRTARKTPDQEATELSRAQILDHLYKFLSASNGVTKQFVLSTLNIEESAAGEFLRREAAVRERKLRRN